jgi:hypothetical protein
VTLRRMLLSDVCVLWFCTTCLDGCVACLTLPHSRQPGRYSHYGRAIPALKFWMGGNLEWHACGHGWQASGWSLWITALVCCGWFNRSSGATTVVLSTPQKRVHTWCIHIFSSWAVRRVVVCCTNVVILAVFFVLHITHMHRIAHHCSVIHVVPQVAAAADVQAAR